jgi:hypothetical protein
MVAALMQNLDPLQDAEWCPRRQLGTHFFVRRRFEGHQPDFFDRGICGGDGLDCRPDGVISGPAVMARADKRERDASRAEFVGNLQRAAVAGLQQRAVALPGAIVRADRVDNPLGG